MTNLRVGILRGGCLLLLSIGILLTSTGCGKEPAPADPAVTQSEPWLRMLATGDPPARVKALAGLAAIGHPVMAEPVLNVALNDHQPQVRIAAIDALGKPGLLDPKQVKSLMFLMNSPDAEVRMAACRAVGVIGPPDAADALVQCMYDREASVRLAATDAIALLGPKAIPKLTGIFAGGSSDQKVAIAAVLAKMRDPSSAGMLTSALKDADDSVRSACVDALGAIGSTSAVPALVELIRSPLSQQNIEGFRQRLRERPSEFDFQMMIKLLDEDCERKKINKDKNKYPWLRSGNAYAPWYAKVIDIRQRDAANQVRRSALAAVVRISPPDLDRLLMELLSDPDDDVGAVAVQEFRARGASARPMLVATAKDRKSTQAARRRAVDIIAPPPPPPKKDDANKLRMIVNNMDEEGDAGDTSARQEDRPPVVPLPPDTLSLFVTLQTDPDPILRAAVASHLGRAGVKEAIPPLLDAFRGADPLVVEKVVVALGSFEDDRIAPVLLPAIGDSRYSSNLVAIITTLGLVGDKKATPALLNLVKNGNDTGTSCLAMDSLAAISDGSAVAPMLAWFDKLIADRVSITNSLPKNATPAEQQQMQDKAWQNEQLLRKAMDFFASIKAREAVPSLTPFVTSDSGGRYGGMGHPAMVALGRIGDPRAVGPISELIAKGGSYHSRLYVNHVTKAGIDALVAIGDPGAIPVLKRLAANWQNPGDPFTGKYAMEGMGRIKHPDGVQVLVNYLVDPAVDPAMKESCVGPALTMAGLAAKEPLLKLLRDSPAPPERAVSDPGMYAAQILAVLSKPDVNIVPSFASIVASKPARHIAHRAVEGLAQTHHEAAVKVLSDIVRTADTEVRQFAALALGTIKLSSAVPALESALKDPDRKVRECAALSLTKYGIAAPADSKE